ncbi:hypothetical protein FACS1894201_08490 [Bacteroidia bacterium]|nr:hypothetical protein FACS1894201_08490 [Bacteroidia bacterium]
MWNVKCKNMNIKEIEILNGHSVIREGENVCLIDTGNPITIHTDNSLLFCGRRFDTVTQGMGGITSASLSAMAGFHFTTLLGADILRNYAVRFDYKAGVAAFSENGDISTDGFDSLPVTFSIGNVPVIENTIAGRRAKVVFDTGAKLSYLDASFFAGIESIGTESDFYPVLGNFETAVYRLNSTFGQRTIAVRYGNLPSEIQLLPAFGVNGIVGFDFLNNFEIVLDYHNGMLFVK